jgi:hypothetical protein
MYPLQCTAGYPMPVKDGKFEIVAISAKLSTVGTDWELSLWDTGVNAIVDEDNPPGDSKRIFHLLDTGDQSPFISFPEPLKTRKGISVGATSGLDAGQIYVYVK